LARSLFGREESTHAKASRLRTVTSVWINMASHMEIP
jgi:hypothetical protein